MIHLIVPPEKSGGVYDFACRLQGAIGQDAVRLPGASFQRKCCRLESNAGDSVVLQLRGYGFAKRRAPMWLLSELEKRRKDIKVFVVYLHELYAYGPPWTYSFWLSPVQRHVARRLAELSDFWMANREGSAQWLREFAGDEPHAVLPVLSNVGELVGIHRHQRDRDHDGYSLPKPASSRQLFLFTGCDFCPVLYRWKDD